jgi:hypothetical protein
MVRHAFLSNFKTEVTQRNRDEFAKAVKTLVQIPGVRNVVVGNALEGGSKALYGVAVFIDLDNEAALKGFNDHPMHKAVAAQILPILGEYLVLDYLC